MENTTKEARLPEHGVGADLAASVASDTTMPQVSNKIRRKTVNTNDHKKCIANP